MQREKVGREKERVRQVEGKKGESGQREKEGKVG